ncbi:MAG TPA: hypothetical protein VFS43_39285, partial [Polyangiaceae bacterium]|nr:hypothetical protein [Polyangiaceae bacterium]
MPLSAENDDDGEPELFLRRVGREHEGPSNDAALLLTTRGDVARPMPSAPPKIDALDDVDRDGRPDLVYYPYSTVRGSCAGFDSSSFGPAFLAHSLPGGAFSTTDAVARAYVARACPTGPERDAEADDDAPPRAPPELCARLRGASEAEALAVLARDCKPAPSREAACRFEGGYCEQYEDRAADLQRA